MNWRRLLVGLLAVAVLSGAGFFVYQQFLAPEAIEETAVTPDVNDIAVSTNLDIVSAEGQVVPLRDARLAFQSGGQVVEILVNPGDVVQAGDALLRLDSVDQEIAVVQAEAAVTQATANVTTAEAGLMAAETGLRAAEVGVEAAQAQLALVEADPTSAQVAVTEASVAAADAAVSQAAGNRSVVLESVTAAQIRAAEARLAAAQAQLFSVRQANEPITQNEDADAALREQAALRLSAATSSVAAAQAALDDLRAGASADERLAADSAVGVAVNQRDAAAAQLELLLAGTRPEQRTVTAVSVEQAESAVAEAALQIEQAQVAVTQAQSALAEAQAALDAAEIALSRRTLRAPFTGTVASVPVKVGEVVGPGIPAIVLADFSEWRIETSDLTELGVVNIARGYEVAVTIDAFPGEALTGEILDIAVVSDVVRGDVTYVTTIGLMANPTLPLRWGMTAFIQVDTNQ